MGLDPIELNPSYDLMAEQVQAYNGEDDCGEDRPSGPPTYSVDDTSTTLEGYFLNEVVEHVGNKTWRCFGMDFALSIPANVTVRKATLYVYNFANSGTPYLELTIPSRLETLGTAQAKYSSIVSGTYLNSYVAYNALANGLVLSQGFIELINKRVSYVSVGVFLDDPSSGNQVQYKSVESAVNKPKLVLELMPRTQVIGTI